MATLIDGKKIAQQICTEIEENIKNLKQKHSDFNSKLAIIQVGNRSDSNVYIKNKLKKAREVGMETELFKLNEEIDQEELASVIEKLNNDKNIDGMILQLPLDCKNAIDADEILEKIAKIKDSDGLTRENAGHLARGEFDKINAPCTPRACLHIIQAITGDQDYVKGKRVVVVGRSKIVGLPAAALFMWHDATVTICHSQTKNLKDECLAAEILIVAIGKPNFIKGDWIKPGAIVIDCGINVEYSSNERKICGDVDFDEARKIAGMITPVPGGVGPVTVAMLLKNTFDLAVKRRLKENKIVTWKIQYLKLNPITPVPSDIEISRNQKPKKITQLANEIGILSDELDLYGDIKAKISLRILKRLQSQRNGKYVLISAITPTPFGEGKSTTVLGLVQALCVQLNLNAIATLRQPSQGPTFGIKGGAAGGGYSQVIPMEEFNLHLTGDIHAITAANNLLAAAIDARIFHESTQNDEALFNRLVPVDKSGRRKLSAIQLKRLDKIGISLVDDANELSSEDRLRFSRLNIDPNSITLNRVIDTNDRFLRAVEIGRGPLEKGHTRIGRFDITVASELMAILAITTDLKDMHERIGKIVVANDINGMPVTVDDLGVTGALTVLMKDAIYPTLMQSLEGTPVLVHAGPFANIAHGQSSIIADMIALKLVGNDGYVVTEAGFGADIGMEKFFDIKCRYSGLTPNAVVIVATIRALKLHGGGPPVIPGSHLKTEYLKENLKLLEAGCDSNLCKQVENALKFGVPVVVCVNRFSSDTKNELNLVVSKAMGYGACKAVVSDHWTLGSTGAIDLAHAVVAACSLPSKFKFLYGLNDRLESKISKIAQEIYGSSGLDIHPKAKEKLNLYEKQGFGHLPVCMAKTHLSLSHDPSLTGAPRGFILPICDVRLSAGAGFVYPLCGEIQTMPGLPTRPCFYDISIDPVSGRIDGLF
ncbi:unnamed protein product [Dracunculus medinensis]|uniref:C-1-tetrahydrofolate synthase, cytoplasmic n=1 Tax=Dracunculus medinensis TaxID=318479 RepID=A0A0N4U990_DRAME|nr:unnamed protein product [Dracunculus medinensis]